MRVVTSSSWVGESSSLVPLRSLNLKSCAGRQYPSTRSRAYRERVYFCTALGKPVCFLPQLLRRDRRKRKFRGTSGWGQHFLFFVFYTVPPFEMVSC